MRVASPGGACMARPLPCTKIMDFFQLSALWIRPWQGCTVPGPRACAVSVPGGIAVAVSHDAARSHGCQQHGAVHCAEDCTGSGQIKIGRTHKMFGLFGNLVAGTGFEPVTFGL